MSDETDNQVLDMESKLKDIKNIEDLDFEELKNMGRGKTPEGIKQKCLQLCQDYLAGNWIQQTVDSIKVERITGGFVNQIYHCSIRDINNNKVSNDCSQEVSIKLYGSVAIDESDKSKIKDMVISLVFSEKNVGPRIYGIFEGGQIQQYYKHRQFFGDDQNNPKLFNKVFQTLAQIHSWQLPIKKSPNTLLDLIEKNLKQGFENFPINDWIEEHNCETLKTNDLKSELNWLWSTIERAESPVVFIHGDYRSSNLMITEPNEELVVCDYDLTGYGYRGYDFVSLLKEWGPSRKQFELMTIEGIQLNDEFKPYIEVYVEECIRIHGKSYAENPINSVDHILKETKVLLLVFYMLMSTMILKGKWDDNDDTPPNPKFMMDFAELNYKNYHSIKTILREQKIID